VVQTVKSPAQAISDMLGTAGIGSTSGSASSWRITTGRQSENPDSQITVYDTGGEPSLPSLRLNYQHIQVRVRGAKDDYQGAYVKINDICEFLNGLTPQDNGGNHYSGVVMIGNVVAIGYDESSRPEFTVNFRCFVEPAADSSAFMHRDSL
jgi:hypothetical protein